MTLKKDNCSGYVKHYPEDGTATFITCTRPENHRGKCRGLLGVVDPKGVRFQMEVYWNRK